MSKSFVPHGVFLVVGLFSIQSMAQEFRATLQGTVTDPSKAALVEAAVTLKNTGTGVERGAKTDNAGHYIFQFLAPGNYELSVKAAGFKTEVRGGIGLSLGDNTRVDVELAIGQATETVQVMGDVATVQAESSSLGSVVRQEIIDTLPLKGHASLFMFTLATGVVNNRYGEDTRANDTITNVSYTSNGSPMASGDVSVDGVANTVNVNRGVNISQWVPAVDAVAEFKLQTGTLPAEYGRAGGNIMNIVIKSGTNSLHGSAYEFLRNAALDANLFFNNANGQRLARYGSNTYGFSVGGPILLPKYDGRNRTFFFFNFEGSREGNGINSLLNVPTEKMRNGDFSEISTVVYNPLAVRTAGGVSTRDPFPGNIVPQNVQDPVGKNVMNFWPKANRAAADPARPHLQNYSASFKWPRDYDMYVIKVDHHFSANNQFFARINFGEGRLVFPFDFDGVATGGRNNVTRPNRGIALNDTVILSPHTTMDIRFGFARGVEDNKPWSNGFDLTGLGFAPGYLKLIQGQAFPNINVTDITALANSPLILDPGFTWSLQPSVTMVRGRHLFKTGADLRLLRGNYFRNTAPAGSFSFGVNQTGGPNAATPAGNTGFGLASMLVGFGSGSLANNSGVSIQNVYSGLYFQDDFRVSSKLTLNLGVRWEYETPRTERYDRTTRGWAYNQASPLQAPGLNLRGGLLYAGGNLPRGIYNHDRNNFAPRLGFAYTIAAKTVIRGGYALSYIPVIGSVSADGFSNTTAWASSTDGGITVTNRLSNPFPTGLVPAVGKSLGLATLLGQGVSFVEPADTYPRFHNIQLDVQRELPGGVLIELAYVASRGIGLIANGENLNQVDPQYFALGSQLTQTVPNPLAGLLPGSSLNGATVQRQQLLRPYPQYTGVTRSNPAFGNSVYHSLQVRVEKRLSKGVTALVSYTRSKNIGDISTPQNAFDRRSERAVTDLDVPERLTIAAAWDLPFGKGRPFAAGINRAADLAIGGWQLSTFSTFQSGFPLGFGVQGGTYPAGVSIRPNVNGDPGSGVSGAHSSRLARYFNTDVFSRPADFTLGSIGPRIGTVRSPGMNNVNLTLSKDFRIVERLKLQFRASQFNILNHPVFGGPTTTVGSANFGRITSQANISRQTEFALRLLF